MKAFVPLIAHAPWHATRFELTMQCVLHIVASLISLENGMLLCASPLQFEHPPKWLGLGLQCSSAGSARV
jgi:hypothetical protein